MKDSFKDVYTYASQALDMIEREKDTNPNYNELKKLLVFRCRQSFSFIVSG